MGGGLVLLGQDPRGNERRIAGEARPEGLPRGILLPEKEQGSRPVKRSIEAIGQEPLEPLELGDGRPQGIGLLPEDGDEVARFDHRDRGDGTDIRRPEEAPAVHQHDGGTDAFFVRGADPNGVIAPGANGDGRGQSQDDQDERGQSQARLLGGQPPGPPLPPRLRTRLDRRPADETAQILGQRLRRGVSIARILLEALQDDGLDVPGVWGARRRGACGSRRMI